MYQVMENHIKTENQKKQFNQILDNYNDEYWSKKYGVSAQDLKNTSSNLGISAKIIEATSKNMAFNS
jgi:hypothetical protein